MVKLLFSSTLLTLLWLASGCASNSQQPISDVQKVEQQSQETGQWVQFGVILEVKPIQVGSSDNKERGMRLEIILDTGRSLVAEQPLSQAGELRVGDRVRILTIGGYSRVTFWPYPADH